jgi:dephospho-CoA kinase
MAFVVGLTGGIGSGKSAAAAEFARLGAAVVDADAIARELTRAGGAAVAGVRRLLGDEYIDDTGAMDRDKVRARVFSDPEAKARLEGLLHPLIRSESGRRIAAAHEPYVVSVVPLLIESPGYRERVQRVLVVDCAPPVQLERVRRRSGLDDEQIRRIMDAQLPRQARLDAADDVIDNSGSLDALHKQVRKLHARYLEAARGAA